MFKMFYASSTPKRASTFLLNASRLYFQINFKNLRHASLEHGQI